jgi:hypothetical protein
MSSIVISGDTSGTITVAAPAVSGTTTLTLPTTSGTVITTGSTFGGTGPAFSAYNGSAQSIPNNTFTKLQFPTEEFDTNSNYDNATNYRFTPTVAGYYQFTAAVNFSIASGIGLTSFYKNGSEFKRGSQIIGGASVQPNSTALIYCNGTTDYVEVYTYQNSGGSINTQPASAQIYFQGFLARSA